jgi:hypothetical protein
MSAMVSLRADAPESAIRPPKSSVVVLGEFKLVLAIRHCTGIALITPPFLSTSGELPSIWTMHSERDRLIPRSDTAPSRKETYLAISTSFQQLLVEN